MASADGCEPVAQHLDSTQNVIQFIMYLKVMRKHVKQFRVHLSSVHSALII